MSSTAERETRHDNSTNPNLGHDLAETKERLDRYAQEHGLKKDFLIESALLLHLSALESLPPGVIVPLRLVVTRSSGEIISEKIVRPPEPTAAMKELFEDDSQG